MAEERMKILEERLTRIEAALTQRAGSPGTGTGGGGGFTPPGGVITDPAPWAGQWQFIPSRAMIDPDPVPWFQWMRSRWPRPVVDPGPFPTPVVDPAPWPNPIVDPAVLAQANLASMLRNIGKVADPAPPDIGRLNISQLEATIHSIGAERARLDAMEQLVNKQLDALKQQQTQKPG
jgi:hypothetical protein